MDVPLKHRDSLRQKILNIFKEEIINLPEEFKYILADDMVTALENRLIVLKRVNLKRGKGGNI